MARRPVEPREEVRVCEGCGRDTTHASGFCSACLPAEYRPAPPGPPAGWRRAGSGMRRYKTVEDEDR